MGSCISKCRPKSNSTSLKESNLLQDKLVITQAPTTPIYLSNKLPNSPSSSPLFSSTTTVTTTNSSCSSSKSPSSSSCSSSISISKDRSFSNEFLWSCAKDNPHVIPADSVKLSHFKVPPPSKSKQLSQPTHGGSIPQKRARAGSPILVPQKSFRREPDRPITPSSLSRRNSGSPSPSRRFNGDSGRIISKNQPKENWNHDVGFKSNVDSISLSSRNKENLRSTSPLNNLNREESRSKKMETCTQHVSHVDSILFSRNKENLRGTTSPSNNLNRVDGSQLKKKETCTHHISPGDDQNAVGLVVSNNSWNALPIDDIDNPLISLDCFIFL